MIYFKTFILVFLFSFFLSSPLFISYPHINYFNILYIIGPVVCCFLLYVFLVDTIHFNFDIKLIRLKFHFIISIILLLIATVISVASVDVHSLTSGDFSGIRDDFVTRDVSLSLQLVPVICVYPFVHLVFLIALKETGFNFKIIALITGLIIIGLTTGGRQTIFILLILILSIRKGKLFKKRLHTYLAILFFALAASLVTIGRYTNDRVDVDKAAMLERYMPGTTISPILKDASDFKKLQDVGLEVSFYFGHVIPSFCSKFDNLDLKIFPPYIFGMQPFIERQLYKVGIINYSQDDRYDKIQSLCLGTVFFSRYMVNRIS